MDHASASPGAQGPTLGPGKASFCFNFTVSSMYPEQLPICKGGSGGSSWNARGDRRGGVEKMTSEMVGRDWGAGVGRGIKGQREQD